MSNQGSSDHRRGFDRYLEGGSGLSKLYKDTATERPPAELDAAILARARDEAAQAPRGARGPFARTWFVPVSVAAVLVLAVGLITFMYEQGGAPFAPKPLPPLEEKTPAEQTEELDRLLRDAPRPDEKATPRKTMPVGAQSPTRSRSVAPQEEAAGATSTAPASAPVPQTAPSQLEERELKPDRLEAPMEAERSDRLAPAAKSAAEALSPEAWLRHIAKLREQGKLTEAEASLAEFKKRYPDYPIETILK
jgi:hypothetical protein